MGKETNELTGHLFQEKKQNKNKYVSRNSTSTNI